MYNKVYKICDVSQTRCQKKTGGPNVRVDSCTTEQVPTVSLTAACLGILILAPSFHRWGACVFSAPVIGILYSGFVFSFGHRAHPSGRSPTRSTTPRAVRNDFRSNQNGGDPLGSHASSFNLEETFAGIDLERFWSLDRALEGIDY